MLGSFSPENKAKDTSYRGALEQLSGDVARKFILDTYDRLPPAKKEELKWSHRFRIEVRRVYATVEAAAPGSAQTLVLSLIGDAERRYQEEDPDTLSREHSCV